MTHDLTVIKGKVKTYILQAVHAENEKIQNDSLIFKEGYIDSMGFILMIVFIEKEFDIKTDDEDLTQDNFESINAITDYISRKLKHSLCAE
jgi:acyl carrier protein